jgi:hypothetical protein
MDGAAVENIAGLARKPMQMNGLFLRPNDWVTEDPAALIKSGPSAVALNVTTLGALRDYLKANKDALDVTKLMVHVSAPQSVQVHGPLDLRSRSRECFLTAVAKDLTDGFLGKYMSLEDFILGLQIRFADADDRKRLLSLLSNVKHETVKTALDDGVTQIVQARAGVALVSDVAVPNPVLLTAYRSFRDIVQPSALFVLRVQSGRSGGLPEVGLFEADGGAWRLSAIERIQEWLVEALPSEVAILA